MKTIVNPSHALLLFFMLCAFVGQAQVDRVEGEVNRKTRNGDVNADDVFGNWERKDGAYPSYSHFSINTGFLSLTRYEGHESLGFPILLFSETSGKIMDYDFLPNWVMYGGYFRYSNRRFDSDFWGDYNVYNIGAGVRLTASVFPAIADLAGGDPIGTGFLDVYGGLQAGYDYIGTNLPGFYSSILLYSSGLRVTPVLGARIYPSKRVGLHAELGGSSDRTLTVGINFRAVRK